MWLQFSTKEAQILLKKIWIILNDPPQSICFSHVPWVDLIRLICSVQSDKLRCSAEWKVKPNKSSKGTDTINRWVFIAKNRAAVYHTFGFCLFYFHFGHAPERSKLDQAKTHVVAAAHKMIMHVRSSYRFTEPQNLFSSLFEQFASHDFFSFLFSVDSRPKSDTPFFYGTGSNMNNSSSLSESEYRLLVVRIWFGPTLAGGDTDDDDGRHEQHPKVVKDVERTMGTRKPRDYFERVEALTKHEIPVVGTFFPRAPATEKKCNSHAQCMRRNAANMRWISIAWQLKSSLMSVVYITTLHWQK